MAFLDSMLERMSGLRQTATESYDLKVPPRPVVSAPARASAPQPVKVPRKARRADPATYLHARDTPLVRLSPNDIWTIEDALSGTHVFGGNGSGKTTGSGLTIGMAFLNAGWGGLILCAKPDEAANWNDRVRAVNQSRKVIVVNEKNPWRFNLIAYELGRPGSMADRVDNLVSTILNVAEQTGRDTSGSEAIWQQSAEQLIRNVLMILIPSKPNLSLIDVQRFIDAIPHERKAVDSPAWKTSEMATRLADARKAYEAEGRLADYEALEHYLTVTFPSLADRTRSSVVFTLSAILQDMSVGVLREIFCTHTNFVPDDCCNGAIIILDLPASLKRSYATAQTLFKVVWQQAMLRRMENMAADARPVMLFVDEAHFFVSEMDGRFLSLARAARVATVFMTQNISAYRAKLGSRNGADLTSWVMGLFQTHVLHAQSDVATIEFSQKLFGKRALTRINGSWSDTVGGSYGYSRGHSSSYNFTAGETSNSRSTSFGGGRNEGETFGRNHSATSGGSTSTTMEHVLEAADFTSLATGSDQAPRHLRGIAQAYIFRLGRTWSTGSTHLLAHFDRRLV